MIKFLLVISALAYIGGIATALYWFFHLCGVNDEAEDEPEIAVPVPAVYPARREIHVDYLTDSCARCGRAVSRVAYPMLICTESHQMVSPHDWCPRWVAVDISRQ